MMFSTLSIVNARLRLGRWPAPRCRDFHTVTPCIAANNATYTNGDCLYGAYALDMSVAYADGATPASPELAALLDAYARCAAAPPTHVSACRYRCA